ncbi:uncharacterized protein LY79DRAFT_534609 [Colletotrichum navitas]|uniref:Uncharacterized protein n=1 Tax=Colletotrichum navitas TaxID=681940 RepID=A0AAD8QDQ8_9PEZI|nr:uncharacterized protein LY79DRAFT_534609 [Colletotrichum navitas]KAK1600766.1 hypothetical protein LY79DRAFT_534609 [Colletotrichum navitas]
MTGVAIGRTARPRHPNPSAKRVGPCSRHYRTRPRCSYRGVGAVTIWHTIAKAICRVPVLAMHAERLATADGGAMLVGRVPSCRDRGRRRRWCATRKRILESRGSSTDCAVVPPSTFAGKGCFASDPGERYACPNKKTPFASRMYFSLRHVGQSFISDSSLPTRSVLYSQRLSIFLELAIADT